MFKPGWVLDAVKRNLEEMTRYTRDRVQEPIVHRDEAMTIVSVNLPN